jgi:carbohydrate-selective porin OprB
MNRAEYTRIWARTFSFGLTWILLLCVTPGRAFSQQTAGTDTRDSDSGGNPLPPTAQQQASQPRAIAPKPNRLDCKDSANPHRRHTGCNDQDFDWDETVSNSLKGVRSHMRELGISPTVSYVGALQTNVTGETHQTWAYAGQLVGGLGVDFGKLLKITGSSVYVGGSWGTGNNLTDSLHNLFPVNSLYAPSYYLGEMYLQQTLLDKDLTVTGGRLAAANSFGTLPVLANYVNYGLDPNPYALGGNDIAFFGPPTGTEWGAQASYNVTPVIQISAGMFNTNTYSANGQNHGTDWSLQQGNKGALVVAQVSYFPHQIVEDQGKQGEYTLGVITDNNSFPTLPDGRSRSGGYTGLFAMGQEMVYQPDGPGSTRGFTVWGSWAYNSKPITSPIPLFWGSGGSYQGLIRRRKNDIVSAGWIYGQISNYVPNSTAEQILELNYRCALRRFLSVTPDLQYIWKPDGRSVPSVAVVGIQLSVAF